MDIYPINSFYIVISSLSIVISDFFLDPISHKVNLLLGNKYENISNHVSGIVQE